MALQITENNGTFYLNGKLNNTTADFFKNYFTQILSTTKNSILNIDKVTEINKTCLAALRDLKVNALLQEKSFSIIGYGCKEIYDDFKETIVA